MNENDFFTLLSKVFNKNHSQVVPDFDLPIFPDSMERDMKPKLVSFDHYLCSIASAYKRLSPQQKIKARQLKIDTSPVAVRFEWKN